MKIQRTLLALAQGLLLFLASAAHVRAGDEADVRTLIARETAGWAKYNPKEVASVYATDAIWQNPFGVRLHGNAKLESFLNDLFARPGYRLAKDAKPTEILDLRFSAPNVAVMWGDESSEGQIDDATGKLMLPRHSYYLEVVVNKGVSGGSPTP